MDSKIGDVLPEPKPSLPFDVFGTDVSKALAREAQRERSREGTSQAQRYDAEAKKLKEAASVARSSGKPMEAIGLEKQAEGMERLAVKEAKAASSSHAKQIEADAEEALSEAEQLRREGKTEEASAKEKAAENLKKQAARVKEMSNVPQPEPLTVMQSISKAEIAAKAQQEAIKRLVQSTIKEQEIERNSAEVLGRKEWRLLQLQNDLYHHNMQKRSGMGSHYQRENAFGEGNFIVRNACLPIESAK